MKLTTTVLTCIVYSVLLSACATNIDGSKSFGMTESPLWFSNAGAKNIEAHFDAMEAHELCIRWAQTSDGDVRGAISSSLKRRGMNPLYCY